MTIEKTKLISVFDLRKLTTSYRGLVLWNAIIITVGSLSDTLIKDIGGKLCDLMHSTILISQKHQPLSIHPSIH